MVPDANDEYFLYQTLLGVFPFSGGVDRRFAQRVRDYAIKAVREAKVHTAWLQADTGYEEAYLSFIDKILDPDPGNAFMQEFLPLQRKVAHFGLLNSLSQTLSKSLARAYPISTKGRSCGTSISWTRTTAVRLTSKREKHYSGISKARIRMIHWSSSKHCLPREEMEGSNFF